MKNPTEADFYGNDGALLGQLLSASQQANNPLSQRVTPRQLATVLVFDGLLNDGRGSVDAVAQHLSKTLQFGPSGIADPTKRRAALPIFKAFKMSLDREGVKTSKPAIRPASTHSPSLIPPDQQFMLINLADLESQRELLDDLGLLESKGAQFLMKALGWTQAKKQAPAGQLPNYIAKGKVISALSRNVSNIETLLENASRLGNEWLKPYQNPKGNGWDLEGLTQALKDRKEWREAPVGSVFERSGSKRADFM